MTRYSTLYGPYFSLGTGQGTGFSGLRLIAGVLLVTATAQMELVGDLVVNAGAEIIIETGGELSLLNQSG